MSQVSISLLMKIFTYLVDYFVEIILVLCSLMLVLIRFYQLKVSI